MTKEQIPPNEAIENITDELTTRYADVKKGYIRKTFKPRGKRLPINNPYGNISERKLRTVYTFLRKVFDHYEKPYWSHVTLHYPPLLPNCSKTIDSCMRSLMKRKEKLATHYIVATEAGIKHNKYHHHVFIYAGSFQAVSKAEKKLKELWGQILFNRFADSFEEHALSDAFDTAHIYRDSDGKEFFNSEALYRESLHKEAFYAARSPLSNQIPNIQICNYKVNHYIENQNSIDNYSKLARSSRPYFENFKTEDWEKEAFYHLSYICKKANPKLKEKRLKPFAIAGCR